MFRKLLIILLALTICGSMTAMAIETPDTDRSCSLTIGMDWEGEPLDGGSLTLCRVGTIVEDDGDYHFALLPELGGGVLTEEELNAPDTARTLAEKSAELSLYTVTAPISEGKAVFEALATGLYVVTQKEATEGYAAIRPFLVSMPVWNGECYVYDMEANPKVPLQPEPTQPSEPSEPSEPTEPTEPGEPDLPQTGQLNWPIPLMACTGLVLFCMGWMLYFRDKREHGHET